MQCYFVNYATTEGCYVEIYGVTLVGITKGVTLKKEKNMSKRQCWDFTSKESVITVYVRDIGGEHWAFTKMVATMHRNVSLSSSSSVIPTSKLSA